MIKLFVSLVLILVSSLSLASANCKDQNFKGIAYEDYDELKDYKRFELLYHGDSPAPVGFGELFSNNEEVCWDVRVTFLKHKPSEKVYAMYTTHDDYCDGGNTMGIIIDLKKYDNRSIHFSDTVVGEIGDSEFRCY